MTQPEFYSASVAASFDKVRSWRRSMIPARIASLARIEKNSRTVDLGCGTGNLIEVIRDLTGCSCVGLDRSAAMLGQARSKLPEIPFVLGDASRVPLALGCCDAVCGSMFLHHVPEERRPDVVAEACRLLAAGHFVLVTVSHEHIETGTMARFFPEIVPIDKARFPPTARIRHWFEAAGFRAVRSEEIREPAAAIDQAFLDWMRNKPISTLELIGEAAFQRGVDRIREELDRRGDNPAEERTRSSTLVYGEKQ